MPTSPRPEPSSRTCLLRQLTTFVALYSGEYQEEGEGSQDHFKPSTDAQHGSGALGLIRMYAYAPASKWTSSLTWLRLLLGWQWPTQVGARLPPRSSTRWYLPPPARWTPSARQGCCPHSARGRGLQEWRWGQGRACKRREECVEH